MTEELINDNEEPVLKIYSSNIQKEVESYYAVKNVSGVITSHGSDSLRKRPRLKLDGIDYFIYTSEEDDRKLKGYYRDPKKKVKLKVRQKLSVASGRVIMAELISFTYLGETTFLSNLSELDKDSFSDFDFNDNEDILNSLGR